MLLYLFLLGFCFCASFLSAAVESLIPQIISIHPHDPNAFTQGLAIKDGFLYESTGLYGQSSLRKIDLQTDKIVKQIRIPYHFFCEGIAILGSNIYQVTWKENTAFVYDCADLKSIRALSFEGEGWGLCCDEDALLMTQGSALVARCRSSDFAFIGGCEATSQGHKIRNLNDIECVGNSIYANIWKKDVIIRLDKHTGVLTGVIDASKLLTLEQKKGLGPEAVLNGIAYHPQNQTFFITGKYWPWLFEVKFIPTSSLK